MRKSILVIVLAMMSLAMNAQTNSVSAYLANYKNFVTSVQKMKSIDNDEYLKLDSMYEALTTQYHDTYKAKMTDDQISTYMKYRTSYKKYLTARRAASLTTNVDTVGHKVTKAVKRTGSKVSGFIKGVFNKK
jgi:predicted small integral membrane protein